MINTQQIVVLMPLFDIQMPANAQIFFGFIFELASFNILPLQDFYDQSIGKSILNPNYPINFYDKYLPAPFWD